jgi:hypothetical protein
MFKYPRLALLSMSLLVLCAFYPDSSPAVPSSPADKSATVTKKIASKPIAKKTAAAKTGEDRAIALVWGQSDVRVWRKNFKGADAVSKLGGHAEASADPDDDANKKSGNKDNYAVHIFENLPDHTATFNWYSVNVKTGHVEKQF